MPNASNDELKRLIEARFSGGNDAVLRSVSYSFRHGGVLGRAAIVVSVKDSVPPSGWSNLQLTLHGVSEMTFREGRATNQILSGGILMEEIGDAWFFDFSPITSMPEGACYIRNSSFYIACKTCEWGIEEYSS